MFDAAVITEQLSNMPIPEMREEDAQLLEGLPDATHAPHAREARLRQIASIPLRHNKSIAENCKNSEVLHEKVRILGACVRGGRHNVLYMLPSCACTHIEGVALSTAFTFCW